MDFTKLEGFKVIYYLVLLIVFVALMVFLLRSAKESLRRTGGKWQSVIDEIFIGFIVLEDMEVSNAESFNACSIFFKRFT